MKHVDKLTSLKDKIIVCIVWFDGDKWRACIDDAFSSNFSNLVNIEFLTDHDDEHAVAYFSNESVYCVNIFDNGNSREIFCPLKYHGTTVTQVAAAYFPNYLGGSGLAPGSQIISLHGKRLEEVLLKCIEHKVDIINLSCTFCPETYVQVTEIIKKMVEGHGIIIVQAAGNDGPFYFLQEEYLLISDQLFCIAAVFT